jgi:hypothetical protein
MQCYIHFDSWAGRTKHKAEILKETPKRFKVKMLEDGIGFKAGAIMYVPKFAVTVTEEKE